MIQRMMSLEGVAVYSEEFLEYGDDFDGERVFFFKTDGDDIETMDEIYLLANGWVEIVADGMTDLYPPNSVLWAKGHDDE